MSLRKKKPDLAEVSRFVAASRAARQRGETDSARLLLQEGLRAHPRATPLALELGQLLLQQKDIAGAERVFRAAVRADPRDPAALVGLGNALRENADDDTAIVCYQRAAALAPGEDAIWFNIGALLRELGRYEEAVTSYDRALALQPARPETWYNRANALTALGQYPESLHDYGEALRLKPGYSEAIFSRSITRLLSGNFATGWDEYEARWQARTFGSPYRFPQWPQWQGESLAGKTLLIWGEQGVGDEIRFLSVFNEIVRDAAHVSYVGDPRLYPLLSCSWPNVAFMSPESFAPGEHKFDVQSPVGSLPRWRRRALEDFPSPQPWLAAEPGRVKRWRAWLDSLGSGPAVGISWRTGRNTRRKQARYAGLDQWGHFLQSLPGPAVCLQYDTCDDDLAAWAKQFGVAVHVPPGLDRRDDFAEQAALHTALGTIVSAPNTVADLAGALGVACWVITHAPHWPWGVWAHTGSFGQPWYRNLTMVDARHEGGWSNAFARVTENLVTSQPQTSRTPSLET